MAPSRRGASATPNKRTSSSDVTPTKSTPVAAKSVAAPAASSAGHHGGNHYEFAGPYLGPVGIILGLPVLVFLYSRYCGASGWPVLNDIQNILNNPAVILTHACDSWSTEVFLVYTAYFLFQAVLYLTLPGEMVKGIVLKDGSQLTYPMNGLLSLLVVVGGIFGITYFEPFGAGKYTLGWIYANLLQLATSTIVFSFLLSFFLYWWSFQAPPTPKSSKLVAEGARNIPLYDFFLGRELNPRVLYDQLDLKFFCELRPGLVMWLLINLACAHHQMTVAGASSSSSSSSSSSLPDPWMCFVVLFQGYYVLDSVLNERSILTTMDITTDGFGFMLAFGDLAWVPGVYALQARFLATTYSWPQASIIGWAPFLALVTLGALGMYIFRASNSQKDLFKREPTHPSVKDLATIPTARGTKLLAGGWWGQARHINYFGDWLMGLSWCLSTGAAPYGLTYFYALYFAVLLIHRDMRDEEKCADKYGESWKKYCDKVKYRFIPGVV